MGLIFRISRRASRAGFAENARVYKDLGQKSGFSPLTPFCYLFDVLGGEVVAFVVVEHRGSVD